MSKIPSKITKISILLFLAFLATSVMAQADCWNYNQGPIWRQTIEDKTITGLDLEGNLLYTVHQPFAQPARLKIYDTSIALEPQLLGESELTYLDGSLFSGSPLFVKVEGDQLLVAGNQKMVFYNVSDPANVVVIGDYDLNVISLEGLDLKNGVVILTTVRSNGGFIESVDISDPTNPVALDMEQIQDDGLDVAIQGNYVFVAMETMGLTIYSMHDPANLVKLQEHLGPGNSFVVNIFGDFAYLLDYYEGLSVFDVSNPLSPVLLQEVPALGGVNLVADADGLFVTLPSGSLRVYPIRPNGTLGSPVGNGVGTGYGIDSVIGSGVVYQASENSGLEVFEIRPGASIPVWTRLDENNYSIFYGLATQGNYFSLIFGDEIRLYDATDKENLLQLGTLDIYPQTGWEHIYGMALSNQVLCVANDDNGLLFYDWSDVNNPVYTGKVDPVQQSVIGVASLGNMAYALLGVDGVLPVGLSNPASPIPYPHISIPGETRDCAPYGNQLAVVNGTKLYLLDVSNPFNTIQEGILDIEQTPRCVAAEGDWVYVGGKNEIYVVDASNPAVPQLEATLTLPWNVDLQSEMVDLAVDGSTLYACLDKSGMHIIDVSDPQNPVLMGASSDLSSNDLVGVSDDYLVWTGGAHAEVLPKACSALSSVSDELPPAARALNLDIAPNPFNPRTSLSFNLPTAQDVRLEIFDLSGKRIADLAAGVFSAGSHVLTWQGKDRQGRPVPSGVYWARLRSGNREVSKTMALVR